jgi:hypothetical protein
MAKTVDFKYAPMFQIGEDKTEYRLLTKDVVSTAEFEGKEIVKVSKEALTLLVQQAFRDVEFMSAVVINLIYLVFFAKKSVPFLSSLYIMHILLFICSIIF